MGGGGSLWIMTEVAELKDELSVLGVHIQRFFVEDRRPWAEVRAPDKNHIQIYHSVRYNMWGCWSYGAVRG